MADYLLPNSSGLTITDKQEIFAMRNSLDQIKKQTSVSVAKLSKWPTYIYET